MHQNINKPKSRAARTVMDPYFYLFMWLLSVFFFFLPKCKYNRIKLCYNRLQFVKNRKLAFYKTQSREPKYVDHSFLYFLLEATCTETWGQASKYYRAGQLVGACIVDFKSTWYQEPSVSLEYIMKIHLADIFYLGESPPSISSS